MAKQTSAAKVQNNGKKSRSPVSVILCVLCILTILLIGFITAGCSYLYSFDFNGVILDNVYVAGVNVGGMTRGEAIAAVTAATEHTYTTQTMTVQVFDVTVEIGPEVSEASLKVKSAVWDAYKYGRRGFSEQKQKDRDTAATTGIHVDISRHVKLDKKAVKNALSVFSDHYNTTLSQSTYEVTGTAPELTLVVNLGVPEYGLNLDELYEQVLDAYGQNTFLVEGECGLIKPDPIDLDKVLKEYAVDPVDAKFDKEFEIIKGSNGCGFDKNTVQKQLDESQYGSTVKIPFDIIEPDITDEELSAMLYRDVLATYTASQGSSSSRATNLRLACEAINGTILLPGQTFSYNETLGERTTEKGYKAGASYNAGEVVTTIGGGICQVSSTLYYCTLLADMEILERENHCYVAGYLPLGMDATVSWGTLDFCFRNSSDYPIRIEAVADGGSTTVTLHGTDTKDYYVKMEYVVTGTRGYEKKYETMKADNPKGYKDGDYIVSPCIGYIVETYRCKYNKENDALISRDYEAKSDYSKRDAVICKIESGSASTPTNPSTPTVTPGVGNGGVTNDNGALPELP